MDSRDELKFVLGSREDHDWLFSTVFSKLQPTQLAEWIIAHRLPVRFQRQQLPGGQTEAELGEQPRRVLGKVEGRLREVT